MNISNQTSYAKSYLIGWIFITLMGSFYSGYIVGVIDPLGEFISIKIFKWNKKEEEFYGGLLGSISSLGALFGVFFAGKLASKLGRKTAILASDIIGLIGVALMSMTNISIMVSGRFISGISVGMFCVLVPIILHEILPPELKGPVAPLNITVLALGMLTSFIFGYGLPYPYKQELTPGNYWKFMTIFPGIFLCLHLILGLILYAYDTPKYLIQTNRENEAKQVLFKIYGGCEIKAAAHYAMLIEERNTDRQANNITFIDLFNKKYRYRTFLISSFAILRQFTGLNVFLTFSTIIFMGNVSIDAVPTIKQYHQAINLTVIVGIVTVISALTNSFITLRYGRKTIVTAGFILLSITWILIIIFMKGLVYDISILTFVIVYNLTIASLVWIYAAEVLPPIGVSFIGFLNWGSSFIATEGFTILLQFISARLTFCCYLGFTIIGAISMGIWMKETKGLSNADIIKLFTPKEILNEEIPDSINSGCSTEEESAKLLHNESITA